MARMERTDKMEKKPLLITPELENVSSVLLADLGPVVPSAPREPLGVLVSTATPDALERTAKKESAEFQVL